MGNVHLFVVYFGVPFDVMCDLTTLSGPGPGYFGFRPGYFGLTKMSFLKLTLKSLLFAPRHVKINASDKKKVLDWVKIKITRLLSL